MELNYVTVTVCITAVHHRSIALPEPLKYEGKGNDSKDAVLQRSIGLYEILIFLGHGANLARILTWSESEHLGYNRAHSRVGKGRKDGLGDGLLGSGA